ncbi:hypothetical protein R3P38DRAFT_3228091 [Favolaschia claudopus]|uniref:Uncharacterized protein n=1 Tax=Favolaschia claudopus TaxID=2862362 RepID=A0AAV9ZQV5_9AGAR
MHRASCSRYFYPTSFLLSFLSTFGRYGAHYTTFIPDDPVVTLSISFEFSSSIHPPSPGSPPRRRITPSPSSSIPPLMVHPHHARASVSESGLLITIHVDAHSSSSRTRASHPHRVPVPDGALLIIIHADAHLSSSRTRASHPHRVPVYDRALLIIIRADAHSSSLRTRTLILIVCLSLIVHCSSSSVRTRTHLHRGRAPPSITWLPALLTHPCY